MHRCYLSHLPQHGGVGQGEPKAGGQPCCGCSCGWEHAGCWQGTMACTPREEGTEKTARSPWELPRILHRFWCKNEKLGQGWTMFPDALPKTNKIPPFIPLFFLLLMK